MISTISHKIPLFPNRSQKNQFFQDCGSAKFVWNYMRRQINQAFKQTAQYDSDGKYIKKSAKTPGFCELSKILTQLRKELEFMKIGTRTAQQQKLKDLIQGYINFYNNPEHFSKPSYKDELKSTRYQDCKYPCQENKIFVAGARLDRLQKFLHQSS